MSKLANTNQSLQEEAKKYKKFLETYKIADHHLHLDGKDFYLVNYKKKIAGRGGMAIISTASDTQTEQYHIAHKWILSLYNYLSSIRNNGSERKNINMRAYHKMQSFLDRVTQISGLSEPERMNYHTCVEAIHSLLELQDRHVDLMEDYQDFVEKKNAEGKKYTIADIEYLQDLLLKLDYIQFKQLNISFNMTDNFAFMEKNVKENASVTELSDSEIERYAKEFADSKNKLRSEISKVSYVDGLEGLSEREYYHKVKPYYLEIQENDNERLKKDLRNA
ncbi:hypothetical protein [Lentibacillus amyloliquefaciens]|uniref:hypothetical protein n=1 Tax=Lentibacillus amyloliquefaciens TaxID=1472767 RepID=UPI00147034E7|nr:hypothetical protein [Lentibacillus amyloliquefaciens]